MENEGRPLGVGFPPRLRVASNSYHDAPVEQTPAVGPVDQVIGQAAQQAQIQLQDRAQTDAIRNQLIAQGMNWAQAEQEARRQVAQMNQQGNIARVGADQNQQQITNQNEQFNRQQGAQETQFAMNFFVNLLKMLAGAGGGAAGAKGVTG
jgi:serine phosphatase RsbU (regulator of sigma subunit)